jgi:hypothetical protein
MTIDGSSRVPVGFSGAWPIVDDNGKVAQQLRVAIELDGINQAVSIKIPDGALDVTALTVKKMELTPLPSSATRSTPFPTSTTTVSGAVPPGTTQIDAFNAYFDALNKKSKY